MATMNDILSGKNLVGLIKGTVSGIPLRVAPELLANPRRVKGNMATYRKVDGNRQLAKITQYGSPSKKRKQTGVSEVPVSLVHSFENVECNIAAMMNLNTAESDMEQEFGRAEVIRQTREAKTGLDSLKTTMVHSALFKGAVHVDGDGNVLPSVSGAKYTIDYGVPAGNRDQLDVFGAGDIIGTTWDNAAAPIVADIKKIKAASLKLPLEVM